MFGPMVSQMESPAAFCCTDDLCSQITTPFCSSQDGDLRYESSSFVVCEDNCDGYQREEQVHRVETPRSPLQKNQVA